MDFRKRFAVPQDGSFRLDRCDPGDIDGAGSEEQAKAELERHRRKLSRQQALLYAERRHAVLVVLQAMDAGGKDGTVNHVFTALNPQGARVVGFKQPTPAERAHDFLWRIHPHTPALGEIAIFNRSHYEDVLITRVHKQIDKATWTERYKRIRGFERLLAQGGTTILKFFLHISREEQLARFAQRLEDPARNWKISESDYTERALWDDYMAAFQDALQATSADAAPWYVIPADHKWFRNLAVSQIMTSTLEDLGMAFPAPSVDLEEIRRRFHAASREAQRGKG